MTKQQFNKLMDKHLNGSASPEEEQQLFEWYDTFQQKASDERPLPFEESAALLERIQSGIGRTAKKRNAYFFWSGIAASFILILCVALLVFKKRQDSPAAALVSITTTKDQKHQVTLPDGSLVWLNAESQLKYQAKFNSHRRELWLTGEGYFEVKHHSKWPFIVHTSNQELKVLGTVFNLKAYPETKTETSLLSGAVEVTFNFGSKRRVVLKPYEKLIAANLSAPSSDQEQPIKIEHIAHEEPETFITETAWTQKAFSFSNESLESITGKLEKVYGIKIDIQSPKLRGERFTGTFDNASISTVLNALQFSNEFEYRKEGEGTIIIY